MRVLSSKILQEDQRKILDNTGIRLSCFDAIQIKEIDFTLPDKLGHCIFTSQNSVRLFMTKVSKKNITNIQAYCVGIKTAEALKSHGISVIKQTNYAIELITYIIEKQADKHFNFFCGILRREIIPNGLRQNNISYKEISLYETLRTSKHFKTEFQAVLFFSPSGVNSYLEHNTLSKETMAICIGTTTAAEVRKFTNNVKISDTTTVESVLWKVKELLINKKTMRRQIHPL